MKDKYLVVGAGITGCVIAENIASQLGKEVLLIDSRRHVGGNCRDYRSFEGILVHEFGPHIFHTNNGDVWNYLSRFTDWSMYFHRVLANIEGMEIPVPFNLNSIYMAFPAELAGKLENALIEKFGYGTKIPILEMRKTESPLLKFLADYVYKNVFLGYTVKQWGVKPEEIDESVSGRIPVYISRDDRYFQDKYQAIPRLGYSKMIENMLKNDKIEVRLGCDFREISDPNNYKMVIYTGKIDEYFGGKYGELPYRSLRFETEYLNTRQFQPVAQMNYPSNFDFTRITEFKHFLPQNTAGTIIAKEYSMPHVAGKNTPFYPINNPENMSIYEKYRSEALQLKNVIFAGRLAEYKYYNMDQAVASALDKFSMIAGRV